MSSQQVKQSIETGLPGSLELDNLRGAAAWAQQSGQHKICAELARCLFNALYYLGAWAEARRWLQLAWDVANDSTEDLRALRASIGWWLASICHDMGDLTAAHQQADDSLELFEQIGDQRGAAEALNLLGLIAMDEDDAEIAQSYFEVSLEMRTEEDNRGRARILSNLGKLASQREEFDSARDFYNQALDYLRAAGDTRMEALTMGNLGALAHKYGDREEARRLYRESLALNAAIHDLFQGAVTLYNLAEIEQDEGALESALVLYIHAVRVLLELNSSLAKQTSQNLDELIAGMDPEQHKRARIKAESMTWDQVVHQQTSGA